MSRFLLLLALAVLSLGLPAIGNAQACGDANGSGGLSTNDLTYMFNYLYQGGPPPVDFDLADFDLHQEWTIVDAQLMAACMFGWCEIANQCPPTSPPWQPVVTAGFRIRHTAAFPAHLEHSIVDLALDATRFTDFQLPLRILIDTLPAQIDSVQFPVNDNVLDLNHNILAFPGPPGQFVLASLGYGLAMYTGPMELVRLYISALPDTASRLIHVEFAEVVPAQAPLGYDNPITPMITDWSYTPVKPSIEGTCCLAPGDANGSGACSISDAVYLINFYFGGGPGPMQCPALGDANGSGSLNISDAVWIINYIFMGGPAPLCS